MAPQPTASGSSLRHLLRGSNASFPRLAPSPPAKTPALTYLPPLPQDKAATVAARWGSLGQLLEAYADPLVPEPRRKGLLQGAMLGGGSRQLGVQSSTAVYELLAKRDPEERVDVRAQ